MAVAAIVALLLVPATERPGHAAMNENGEGRLPRKCAVQLRQCNSQCNKVYESKRALVACRDRCKDAAYGCKDRLD